jgi:hypothetical protein
MITIAKNKNFSNWFDLRVFGQLIDQFSNEQRAMHMARRIRRKDYPAVDIKVVER